jgi:hypothetical protein
MHPVREGGPRTAPTAAPRGTGSATTEGAPTDAPCA